ncbi:MAG: hypothetical protein PVJ69_04705 [Desulfobacteraceae bacterium]|jgi:hypothetical protein
MPKKFDGQHLKLWTPATYRITVEGKLDKSWSDRLGGMRITAHEREDQTTVTTLIGQVRDQAELAGVLNSLYELHMPILSVENLSEDNGEAGHDPGQSSPSESEAEESTK